MQFKLVRTGKSYVKPGDNIPIAEPEVGQAQAIVPPIIWETGNVAQIRSLLVLREAELVAARPS